MERLLKKQTITADHRGAVNKHETVTEYDSKVLMCPEIKRSAVSASMWERRPILSWPSCRFAADMRKQCTTADTRRLETVRHTVQRSPTDAALAPRIVSVY